MKKISVVNWISVDGIFSGPDGDTNWFTQDDEMEQDNLRELPQSDTIIFGRKTFEMMAAFWPTPGAQKEMPRIAEYMNEAQKHTFSKTVKSSPWEHSFFHTDINTDAVEEIKQKAQGDIVVLGSGEICKALHQLRLIDEYTILLDPQILGNGKVFFKDFDATMLELLNSKVYKSGTVRLVYRVIK